MPELPACTLPPPRPPGVTMMERTAASVDPAAWDVFVQSCEGSFLGAWRVVRANRMLSRVRLFEFFAEAGAGRRQKVGQCAVAIAQQRVRFIDRLHILPECGDLWDCCLQLVITRCGAATYEYGSTWNREHRVPPAVVGASGLVAEAVPDRPFLIDRVDFSRWTGFEAYRKDVSENIRRDYKKAAAMSARVETRCGLAALRDVPTLVRLRQAVMDRNHERFRPQIDFARHVLKLLCIGDMSFIATAWAEGRCHASFFGVRFGGDVYYLAGGTESTPNGYGSFLFLTLIEQGFANGPHWRLYLGRQSACVDPATYTRGNQLYRRKLRATSSPGTAFRLQVALPAGGSERREASGEPHVPVLTSPL